MKRYLGIACIFLLMMLTCNIIVQAQIVSKYSDIISINGTIREDKKARVIKFSNQLNDTITVVFINGKDETKKTLIGKETKDDDITCEQIKVQVHGNKKYGDGSYLVWRKERDNNIHNKEQQTIPIENIEIIEIKTNNTANNLSDQNQRSYYSDDLPQVQRISQENLLSDFDSYLSKSKNYYSQDAIDSEKKEIEDHINNLEQWDDKEKYLREQGLEDIVQSLKDSLKSNRNSKTKFINDFLKRYKKYEIIDDDDNYNEKLEKKVNSLLEQREDNIKLLEDAIDQAKGVQDGINWQLIAIVVGVALLLIALISWYVKTNKKNKYAQQRQAPHQVSAAEAASSIVVRRKTTSILRKQSLEDVMDNKSYLAINCNEFCNDSAVRRMYIKNTCIKDIYNMYAEDLRNPDNPKEDGCMVLGRWVYDKDNNDYYVSLEHVVLPGDDAIFAEYELNFGGKIKLKVTEKLRKLRRDTGLQYDLTCWVHSHPGLGVFFSNSDTNVQMQLKHPTHPNFLTAIVIDILTPQQEMGIFTFKKDSSINSKNDLTRMYSLEELYQWAVESDRNLFKPEDYYNTLVAAKSHTIGCYGIELSNGAIIDISKFAMEQTSGFVGMVHGYAYHEGAKTEHIAKIATTTEAVPDNELIGAFVITAHLSIPSIRKAIAPLAGKIRFVLVYTTTDGLLTSIPVVNNELCSDETYYGEQTLEELKIWTRRKR